MKIFGYWNDKLLPDFIKNSMEQTLKNNPAYSDIIASVSNFDELITNNPECLGELE